MAALPLKHCAELSVRERDQLFHLWNREYPLSLRYADTAALDRYLAQLSNVRHYLLHNEGQLQAWAVVFDRNDERWFAIIVDEAQQGCGTGRALLQQLQRDEPVLNGWVSDREGEYKADGSLYRIPLSFYLRNGFTIVPGERLELPQLSALKIRWRADE
ncbi:GNAT family N-acetyltransferase [Rurimicrobium arvi]|uniref:N-acetyltransferase domain-containing protein n=1 Tax=Rurimicrobium arvi TaxID=2049916 RepID=A0ABP8N1B0_9BACT